MSLFIDIHSHLDHELIIDKIDEIVSRAKLAGVKHIIANGINPESNRKCLEISKKYDILKCGMGIYPRSALKKEAKEADIKLKLDDFDINQEIEFIKSNKENIVAVSEVGLDFVGGESQEQIEDFQKMIDLAKELDKPIVIHSRKAERKCIEILEKSSLKKIVMHCFSGKKSLVKRIVDNKWFLSIPTSVVRSEQFQSNVRNTPITQLFCETDSPYLSPFREKINEPSFVVESYKKIAELKGMEISEVANNIYMNWQNVFE
jgi:TatD DNase family protein